MQDREPQHATRKGLHRRGNVTTQRRPADGQPLPHGGAMRVVGPTDGHIVICLGGGTYRAVPGQWSPSMEWLTGRLACALPELGFVQVRYHASSWRALDALICDARDAILVTRAQGAQHITLIGFSAGGATALAAAGHDGISEVIGLAPWIPDEMDLSHLAGTRIQVIHGSWDGYRWWLPGVSPHHSLAGVARLQAAGADATHSVIDGAVHGIAVRRCGRLIPLPKAARWERAVVDAITATSR